MNEILPEAIRHDDALLDALGSRAVEGAGGDLGAMLSGMTASVDAGYTAPSPAAIAHMLGAAGIAGTGVLGAGDPGAASSGPGATGTAGGGGATLGTTTVVVGAATVATAAAVLGGVYLAQQPDQPDQPTPHVVDMTSSAPGSTSPLTSPGSGTDPASPTSLPTTAGTAGDVTVTLPSGSTPVVLPPGAPSQPPLPTSTTGGGTPPDPTNRIGTTTGPPGSTTRGGTTGPTTPGGTTGPTTTGPTTPGTTGPTPPPTTTGPTTPGTTGPTPPPTTTEPPDEAQACAFPGMAPVTVVNPVTRVQEHVCGIVRPFVEKSVFPAEPCPSVWNGNSAAGFGWTVTARTDGALAWFCRVSPSSRVGTPSLVRAPGSRPKACGKEDAHLMDSGAPTTARCVRLDVGRLLKPTSTPCGANPWYVAWLPEGVLPFTAHARPNRLRFAWACDTASAHVAPLPSATGTVPTGDVSTSPTNDAPAPTTNDTLTPTTNDAPTATTEAAPTTDGSTLPTETAPTPSTDFS